MILQQASNNNKRKNINMLVRRQPETPIFAIVRRQFTFGIRHLVCSTTTCKLDMIMLLIAFLLDY